MDTLPLQNFWLTRDRHHGKLAEDIEVWFCKPEPLRYDDGDVTWIAPLGVVDRAATYAGIISIARAISELGNGVPTTERECLRVQRGQV